MSHYEIALHAIADEIRSQTKLERHQKSEGIKVDEIDFGRASSYVRIVGIVSEVLGIEQEMWS